MKAIAPMAQQPVVTWREPDFALGPEGSTVLLTLMLDILRHDRAEWQVGVHLFWGEAWLARMLDIVQTDSTKMMETADILGRGVQGMVALGFMAPVMYLILYSVWDEEASRVSKDRGWTERVFM